jgi:SanA protein
MDAAIQLYRQGSVEKLIVSGDGLAADYDEPAAMMSYAVGHGVEPDDILVDRAGRRTYDTCYRAQSLYGVQEAILVTQEFHLSRALFVCERLGIEADGVAADRRAYRAARWYELRETAATIVALSDVIRRREPAITTLVPTIQGNR